MNKKLKDFDLSWFKEENDSFLKIAINQHPQHTYIFVDGEETTTDIPLTSWEVKVKDNKSLPEIIMRTDLFDFIGSISKENAFIWIGHKKYRYTDVIEYFKNIQEVETKCDKEE
jgi:hypothetical protein